MQTYYGNVKSVLVVVGVGMMWAKSVLYQVLRVHECKTVSSDHIFTQLRGLQFVVTQVGTYGDPHYTSCTDPVQTYSVNVKCVLVGVGMMWAKRELDQVFRVHEYRAVSSDHKFTQLRGLQYVVTQVGTFGDPHYTSCTDPRILFLKCQVSVHLGWGGA